MSISQEKERIKQDNTRLEKARYTGMVPKCWETFYLKYRKSKLQRNLEKKINSILRGASSDWNKNPFVNKNVKTIFYEFPFHFKRTVLFSLENKVYQKNLLLSFGKSQTWHWITFLFFNQRIHPSLWNSFTLLGWMGSISVKVISCDTTLY